MNSENILSRLGALPSPPLHSPVFLCLRNEELSVFNHMWQVHYPLSPPFSPFLLFSQLQGSITFNFLRQHPPPSSPPPSLLWFFYQEKPTFLVHWTPKNPSKIIRSCSTLPREWNWPKIWRREETSSLWAKPTSQLIIPISPLLTPLGISIHLYSTTSMSSFNKPISFITPFCFFLHCS